MTRFYHQRVVFHLRELADADVQRRLWLSDGVADPEVSSFTEAVCGLFDDSGLGHLIDRHQRAYTEEIDERLRALGGLLQGIDDLQAPPAILEDPKLHRVSSIAQALLADIEALEASTPAD